jgi:hypothetical protein
MKQTAVEWLMLEKALVGYIDDEMVQQALELEKKQIIAAYEYSYGVASFKTGTTSEQYYNETYKPSA